jgi:hypothetical protein
MESIYLQPLRRKLHLVRDHMIPGSEPLQVILGRPMSSHPDQFESFAQCRLGGLEILGYSRLCQRKLRKCVFPVV